MVYLMLFKLVYGKLLIIRTFIWRWHHHIFEMDSHQQQFCCYCCSRSSVDQFGPMEKPRWPRRSSSLLSCFSSPFWLVTIVTWRRWSGRRWTGWCWATSVILWVILPRRGRRRRIWKRSWWTRLTARSSAKDMDRYISTLLKSNRNLSRLSTKEKGDGKYLSVEPMLVTYFDPPPPRDSAKDLACNFFYLV